MLQVLKTDPAAHRKRSCLFCRLYGICQRLREKGSDPLKSVEPGDLTPFRTAARRQHCSSTREDLPMPANKGAESKQGLIITLVGFVLLSIILGVTTYYGYAEQDALKKAAADAKNEAAAAKKNRDWYKYVALKLKEYT